MNSSPLRPWRALLLAAVMFSPPFFVRLHADPPTHQPVAAATEEAATEEAATEEASVRPGINKGFLARDLDVSEWIERFELESREVFANRNEVVEALKIEPGDEIADIGAGTGFYSRLFAAVAGDGGWVYSVEISPRFLEHINFKAREDNVRNLTGVLCTDRSIKLPPGSIDLAFVCDAYHHFEYPQRTLRSIHRALREDGTLAVIDFERIPGESREFILGHVRAGKEVFRAEIVEAGFELIEEVKIEGFKENYFLRFRKQESAAK